MVPQVYRFVVVNNSGQLLTYNNNGRINLKVTAWFITPSTGKVDYTQLGVPDYDLGFIAASTLADGDEIVQDVEINNLSSKFIGLQVQLEITHDEGLAADGTFDIYISAGDATGELPTDRSNYGGAETSFLQQVGSLTWVPNADDDVAGSDVFNL